MTGLVWDTSGWGQTKPGIVRTHLRAPDWGSLLYSRQTQTRSLRFTYPSVDWKTRPCFKSQPMSRVSTGSWVTRWILHGFPREVRTVARPRRAAVNCGKCLSVALTAHNVRYYSYHNCQGCGYDARGSTLQMVGTVKTLGSPEMEEEKLLLQEKWKEAEGGTKWSPLPTNVFPPKGISINILGFLKLHRSEI